MIRNISVGIDIGTAKIKIIIAEIKKGDKKPNIIGFAENEILGLRRGNIISINEVSSCIKKTIQEAEKSCNVKIRKAILAIGGNTLKSEVGLGNCIITKVDNEVTELDIDRGIEDSKKNLNLNNKKILKILPISYKLDGKEILSRVEGCIGKKLEVKTLFITSSIQHIDDLLSIFDNLNIKITNIVPNILASENVVLSKKEKIVGCVLVNIGAETTSFAVFENEKIILVQTLNIGGNDITNDIALMFKISLEEAERIKMNNSNDDFPKKKVDEIIEARLSDIFELIDNNLKKIKRNELLPGGVILIGGGANTEKIVEISKEILKLPTKIGSVEFLANIKTKFKNPSYFTTIGLLNLEEGEYYNRNYENSILKDFKNVIKNILRQFNP